MTTEELSYLAGIIDGEGNIGIQQIQALRKYKGEINKRYNCYLRITNTDKRLLEWILKKVGHGKIFYDSHYNYRPNSRRCFGIRWNSKKAESILKLVYPYLVIKKEQAEVIFNFMSTYTKGWPMRFGLPKEIIDKRNEFYEELKRLHHIEYK